MREGRHSRGAGEAARYGRGASSGEALNGHGGAVRLLCFPYAGGSASSYRRWQAVLGPMIDVRPVALPGRDALFAQPALASHSDAMTFLLRTLLPECDGACALYGHSMGARLAFEFARELRRFGLPAPTHLFITASPAPQLCPVGPLVAGADDERFIARIREIGGTPEEVFSHPELAALLLPLLRADFAVAESYRYRPAEPLDCPISVWGGTMDAYSKEHLEGWRDQTRSAFRVRMLPGGHFFIRDNEEALLDALRRDLAEAVAVRRRADRAAAHSRGLARIGRESATAAPDALDRAAVRPKLPRRLALRRS